MCVVVENSYPFGGGRGGKEPGLLASRAQGWLGGIHTGGPGSHLTASPYGDLTCYSIKWQVIFHFSGPLTWNSMGSSEIGDKINTILVALKMEISLCFAS